MAKLSRSALILLFGLLKCFTFDLTLTDDSFETDFVKFDNLAAYVLKTFNEKPDSVYQYKSAEVITGLKQNDTESASYYLNLDFAVACNSDLVSPAECFPKHLLCKVVVTEDPNSGEWQLRDEATSCNLPATETEDEPESDNASTDGPGSMEKQEEDMKAMFDDLGPFLLKHLNPLSETVVTAASGDIDMDHPVDEDATPVSEVFDTADRGYVTGGKNNVDTDAPGLQALVEKALTSLDASSQYKHKLVDIAKAESEVTNQVHYYLTLVVGETSCSKSSSSERSACQLRNTQSKTCFFDMVDSEVRSSKCDEDDNNELDNDILPRSFNTDVMDYLDGMDYKFEEDEMGPYQPEAGVPQVRERREVGLGGLKDMTASEKDLVQRLAKIAVNTLDEIDADDSKRIVLDVLDAKKQLVNGVMYHLKLRVGTTACDENGSTTPGCLQEQVAAPKLCTIHLHRSFAADSPNDVKVVKSECTNEPRSRHRRQGQGAVGGFSPANPRDPYIQEIANFALAELDKGTNSQFRQQVVRVSKAEQQVVSGMNYELTLELVDTTCKKNTNKRCPAAAGATASRVCKVVVYDQPWTKTRKLISSACENVPNRGKREVEALHTDESGRDTQVGGYRPANPNDPHIQEMASFAVAELDKGTNSKFRQHIVRVSKAEQQVVSGMNYKLTLELVESKVCKKSTKEACPTPAGATASRVCKVVVYDQPWTKTRKLISSACENVPNRGKRELEALHTDESGRDTQVGGYRPANPNDPHIQEIAKFALAELDKGTNSKFRQHLVRVSKAEQQVVSGMNYKLTLELVESKVCKKSTKEACPTPAGATASRVCQVVVWDQPWLKKRQITSSSCENVSRGKRDTKLGGHAQINVKDAHLQPLAQKALAHIEAQSNALYAQKIVKIVSASKQIVSGVKYTITMEVGYTSCRKPSNPELCEVSGSSNNQMCTVVVTEQPWRNLTTVSKASCTPVTSNRVKRALLIGGGTHDIHAGMFRAFMTKHGKTYATKEEEKRRYHIFRANMKKVETLQKTEQGTGKYGATRFADLTSKEFKKHHLGLNPALKSGEGASQLHQAVIPQITLPPEFDWRHYNVVTPVKNQGMCGSCWAFSVTGNVEGQWALRHQELLSLSEQELVDCDKLDSGCEGGLPENAYKAITSIGGLETEGDYPYDGADETCHFNKTEARVTVTGGLNITSNETQMAQWLVKNGPISIGINANAMQFYMGGVSHPWKFLCSQDNLDHGVLIVGYGVHNYPIFKKSLPFWIVKNSWGPSWGEQGYYRVYRGDGTCGVNQMATSAIVG